MYKRQGVDSVGLRLPSLILGWLCLWVLDLIARRMDFKFIDRCIILTLGAVSPMLIYYSQEARSYSLLAFLSLLSFYFFLGCLDRSRWIDSLGYAVSISLLIFVHRYGLFFIFTHMLCLIAAKKFKLMLRLAALCALPGLFFLKITVENFSYASSGTQSTGLTLPLLFDVLNIGVVGFDRASSTTNIAVVASSEGLSGRLVALIGSAIIMAVLALTIRQRGTYTAAQKYHVGVVWMCFSVPVAIAFLAGTALSPRPQWLLRGLIYIWPIYYLIVGFAVQRGGYRYLLVGCILILNCGSLYVYYAHYTRLAQHQAFAYLQRHSGANDLIVASPWYAYELTAYYYGGAATVVSFVGPNQWIVPQADAHVRQFDVLEDPPVRTGNVYVFYAESTSLAAMFPNNPIYFYDQTAQTYKLFGRPRAEAPQRDPSVRSARGLAHSCAKIPLIALFSRHRAACP